jgi:hypothetical protein
LVGVVGGVWFAPAPSPAVNAQRWNETLLDAFTSTAILDRPLPPVSKPEALGAFTAMSSMSTAAVPALTVSAIVFIGPMICACAPT